jgi:Protein of unknown function (DUF4235)
MLHRPQNPPTRRVVAGQLVGDQHPRHILQALEQLIFGPGSTRAKPQRRQRATPRQFQRPTSAAPEASTSLVVLGEGEGAGDAADPVAALGTLGGEVVIGDDVGDADAPPSSAPVGGGLVKILSRPLGLLISVLGGILAGAVFKKVWTVVSGEEEAPEATSPEYSTKEVLVAAVVQGAIFAGVKAAVDRAGAKGFKKVTGKDLGT